VTGAAIGSEKPKKGRARLMNPFLYVSSFLLLFVNWREEGGRGGLKYFKKLTLNVNRLIMFMLKNFQF
jgi:hypothetical protein